MKRERRLPPPFPDNPRHLLPLFAKLCWTLSTSMHFGRVPTLARPTFRFPPKSLPPLPPHFVYPSIHPCISIHPSIFLLERGSVVDSFAKWIARDPREKRMQGEGRGPVESDNRSSQRETRKNIFHSPTVIASNASKVQRCLLVISSLPIVRTVSRPPKIRTLSFAVRPEYLQTSHRNEEKMDATFHARA